MTEESAGASEGGGSLTSLMNAIRGRADWLIPAIVASIGIVPAVLALRAQTFAILGRDQGIFQYVAWALRHGERAYRDIHEINGPLPHAWHVVMQTIGGEDEHVFRSIDTVMLVLAYAFAAMTIPRWIGLDVSLGGGSRGSAEGGHASGLPTGRTRDVGERGEKRGRAALIAWAFCGLAVLGAQYARYDWWHTSQREGFYSILVLTSLALQSLAHSTQDARRASVAFLGASVTTTLTWFGKPPCVIFSVLQLGVFMLDRKNVVLPLRRVAVSVVAGAALVTMSMLAFVIAYEDVGRGIEMLSKVPRLHHTIWNETLLGSYRAYNNAPRLDWAMATFAAFIVTYALLKLPRRALLGGVLPAGGFVVFAAQGKAFPYHLHMLTVGTAVLQLVILGAIARYVQTAHTSSRRLDAITTALLLGAILIGAKSGEDAWKAPSLRHRWAEAGATASLRTSRAYVERFPWGDYFANDLRDAAAYLAFHTRPDERVQTYGFDPYLLFLARRKSASPVIYSFELNVDAALEGGPGARPSPELKSWLVAYRDDAEQLVLRSVKAAPPAAFTLHDRAPFTHPEDAERDFEEHCPALSAWMKEHYVFTAAFGTVRIWLRRDVSSRPPAMH